MKLYVLLLMAVAFKAQAASPILPEVPFKKIPCEKNVSEFLKTEFAGTTPDWNREIDADSMTRTYRASKKTGQWYELNISEKEAPKLYYISADESKDYTWDTKSCSQQVAKHGGLVLFKNDKKKKVESFTDKDLEKLLAGKTSGIIYLWSPHMVYSMTEFRVFRDVAKAKGIEFIPVLDPAVDINEAKAAFKKIPVDINSRKLASSEIKTKLEFSGRKLASVDLYMRNGTTHFPSTFVYANGKLNPRRLIGVFGAEGLAQNIDVWMGELK